MASTGSGEKLTAAAARRAASSTSEFSSCDSEAASSGTLTSPLNSRS